MKRAFCITLVLFLLTLGCGCSFHDGINTPVSFYYLRHAEDYTYGSPYGVIAPEQRECAGHEEDLLYLLTLYLRGPLDTQLYSPFPAQCRIVELYQENDKLHLTLNDAFSQLEALQQTLACACLAQTCFAISDATSVQIDATAPDGNSTVNITLSRDNLILEDDSHLLQPTEAAPQS